MPPTATYRPRASQDTALHRLVREHLATFVAHTEAAYAAPLPRYVIDAFERYVACGDFSRGFIRCHCDACAHDVLVPFSCKGRGVCPSCCARRMCNEAASITDRVLPNAPLRQWVLSLPFERRGLAATKPDVLTAFGRIFAEEIARATKRLADVAGSETGAISFPQRFGGSLNLHVHFHTLAIDGVFEKAGDSVRVHEAPPPEKADVEDVAKRVHDRALRWLRRHRYLDERAAEDRSNETAASTPMDDFSRIALAGGDFLARPFAPPLRGEHEPLEKKLGRFAASHHGFDVHCAVRIAADDDEGRERLVRYCARPPFALDRIEQLKDGRVTYLMKTARRGSTHRVMSPVEFLARLAILIPPPYFPLVRYHGVFAARSAWRPLVTPKPPASYARPAKRKPCKDSLDAPDAAAPPAPRPLSPSQPPPRATPPTAPTSSAPALIQPAPGAPPLAGRLGVPVVVDPTVITTKHWARLLDGQLFASASRIDWQLLLQRTFGFDALTCPTCSKRMRVLATILEPDVVRKILRHLGVRADPLPLAPARNPTGQTNFDFDAA